MLVEELVVLLAPLRLDVQGRNAASGEILSQAG